MSNTTQFSKILLFQRKSPSVKAKGLGMVRLPLVDTFRTFKEDIVIDNIKLNQLVFR